MVNSIKKGKTFEREVANLLTEKTGVKWLRVPMSGGFATVNKSTDPRFDGDVFTEDPKFIDYVIECKSNKNDINLNKLFNDNSLFWNWVDQAETESRGKRWLLFIKLTRTGTYVVCENTQGLEVMGLPTKILLKLTRTSANKSRNLQVIKLK